MADSYKKHTAVEVGYAAMDGEKDTYDNYKDLVNENYYVVPIAHKTMGSWAPDSLKFMKDLGSRVCNKEVYMIQFLMSEWNKLCSNHCV